MRHLRIHAVNEKQLQLTGIDPVLAGCLQSVPDILEHRDAPGASHRLSPDLVPGDATANEDWHRLLGPELRHLFVSAGETLTRDLTALEPDPQGEHLMQLTFSSEHLSAWISALNQARLILGELHQVTEADMNSTDFDLSQPKGLALFQIHILGFLLQLFIELQSVD